MAMPNWRPIRRCLTSDVINVFIYSSVRDYCQFYIYQTTSIHSIYFIHHRFDYDDTFALLSQLLNRQHFNLISVSVSLWCGPDVSYPKVSPNLQLKFSDILNEKKYIYSFSFHSVSVSVSVCCFCFYQTCFSPSHWTLPIH